MAVAVITGSAGLIGAEASRCFAGKGLDVVGIDNDMRREFFGEEASTIWSRQRLKAELVHHVLVVLLRGESDGHRLLSCEARNSDIGSQAQRDGEEKKLRDGHAGLRMAE